MHIHLQQLSPKFLERERLQASGIWTRDVAISPGEKVHIIAPSGSGKTSLVHFLYGLRRDYDGKLLFNQAEAKALQATEWASLRQQELSIVFQDLRLFTTHTVRQNIAVKRALSPYREDRLTDMAKRLGLENKLDRVCGTCSYGEQQRIAIIRALQQPFSCLLLDEPFSHLDEANREKAMELIEEERSARQATVILADLREITYFGSERTIHL